MALQARERVAGCPMEIRCVTADGVRRYSAEQLGSLPTDNAVLWIDVPQWDAAAAAVLTERVGIHPRAAEDCARRNPVPKVHVYPGHVFLVLHGPEKGAHGHIHYLELDQFVGPDWVVTVHGPLNQAVPLDAALAETRAVARRLESGRLHPATAADLSFAIASALRGRPPPRGGGGLSARARRPAGRGLALPPPRNAGGVWARAPRAPGGGGGRP